MLKVAQVNNEALNILAPSIFIDSVEIEDNSKQETIVSAKIHLEDPSSTWSLDKNILQNIDLNVSFADQLYKENLQSFINNSQKIGSNYYSTVQFNKSKVQDYNVVPISFITSSTSQTEEGVVTEFFTASSDVSGAYMIAVCGNDSLHGQAAKELIYLNNNIAPTSFTGSQFEYFSKIKNLNLLNFSINISSSQFTNTREIEGDLLIGYRTDKKANVGFLFNLESFLANNSTAYKILSRYPDFKQIILNNTKISETTAFFKRNISLNEEEYSKINSKIFSYKLDDNKNIHYVSFTDDNTDINNKNVYKLKTILEVKDYSYELFNTELRQKFTEVKKNIEEYISVYKTILSNNLIKNKNKYLYENKYENFIQKIQFIIDSLSPIYAFLNNKTQSEYVSLFLSILHPLSVDVEILQKFLFKIQQVEEACSKILEEINAIGTPDGVTLANDKFLLKKEYYFNSEVNELDYNYDYGCGYQVFTQLTHENLLKEPQEGIKIISDANREARKLQEIKRYVPNISQAQQNLINYYSISFLTINETNFDLLAARPEIVDIFNQAFINLQEYVDFNFNYRKLESIYYQFCDNGVSVDTIANAANTSVNGLQKSVLFDPNIDSQQASLQLITSTGIQRLYLSLNKYLNFTNLASTIPVDSFQYKSLSPNSTSLVPTLPLSTTNLKNIDLFPKILFFYSSLHIEKEVFVGGNNKNYNIYRVVPVALNISKIFTKKIRHLNDIYMIKYKEPAGGIKTVLPSDYQSELNLNIEPKYLNRTIETAKILLDPNTL